MKVKVREKVYDTDVDDVEITLTMKEKESICSMPEDAEQYCVHPGFMRKDEVIMFIQEEVEDDL